MNSLILVDIQNDFLPGGALAVPDGDAVIPVANRVMRHFPLVVATRDWHPANHASFAANCPGREVGQIVTQDGVYQLLWPIHCVQGSPGADFPTSLEADRIDRVFDKGCNPSVDSYSGFFDNNRRHATGLDEFLTSRGVTDVFLIGLATDYCVKATALDACRLGYKTHLIQDGCRGVELHPGDVQRAIDEMRQAGVRVTSSTEIDAELG